MKRWLRKMGLNNINWLPPPHMVAATRAVHRRVKLVDLVIEVRDARIPLSSANEDLQPMLCGKRRVIALNKKDLANPNIMHRWIRYFNSCKQECLPINAHSRSSVQKEKMKRATVGPLPGVTQDIAGYKIAHLPSIYVLDTPGVLVPSIPDMETGLKLALAGSFKDSVVGEERIVQYLLAVLNTRGTPLHWRHLIGRESEGLHHELGDKPEYNLKDLLPKRRKPPNKSDIYYIEDMISEVQRTLCTTLSEFVGNLEDEGELETLIDQQFEALQTALKIPYKALEARTMVSKKILTLFRTGKLGPFILDDVPDASDPAS
ncbi:short integuments 2, mitochondrial-like isoform X2 [Lycium barbarum]|uniref:short integuments 2, mitochondrial-like isoform X2 n=1 Tax=Lycium barbarum TaxID=112863 RepID=UPI00293EE1B3|nr:short integuments 2, mitochondrial-like isoform X2 [Lycium barbarum]